MFKRIIAGLLVVVMLYVIIESNLVIAVDNQGSSPSLWAQVEIEEAKNLGLSVERLQYQDKMTRLTFVSLIVELIESIEGSQIPIEWDENGEINHPFTDTRSSSVYKAYSIGIIKGVSKTTFSPNQTISREQISTILVRMMDYLYKQESASPTVDTTTALKAYNIALDDDRSISQWAYTSVIRLYAMGILQGVGNNLIAPKTIATNEQGILLIVRAYKYMAKNLYVNNKLPAITEPVALNQDIQNIYLKEMSTTIIHASDLVQETSEKVYFVGDSVKTDQYRVFYNSDYTLLVVDTYALNTDFTKFMDITVTDGMTEVEGVLNLRFQDIRNYAPTPNDEEIYYDVDRDETLIISVSDIATDDDGDKIYIESYRRVSPAYGLASLNNSPTSSIFSFKPYSYDAPNVTLEQIYDLTISDGNASTTVRIYINIYDSNYE